MPVSMMFWSAPGSDSAGSSGVVVCEAEDRHHRVPPPALAPSLGNRRPPKPVPDEPRGVSHDVTIIDRFGGRQDVWRRPSWHSVRPRRRTGAVPDREATIAGARSDRVGQTTCQAVVQAYIDRAKAYTARARRS